MRDRHFPRLCRSCRGTDGPPGGHVLALRHSVGGRRWAANDAAGDSRRRPDRLRAGPSLGPSRVTQTARAAADARLDADRRMNEGGSFDSEAAALLRAVP